MSNKEIIIKVENEKISFSSTYWIPFHCTNFPEGTKFRTNIPIFWKVEMIAFDSIEQALRVKIIDYSSKDINRFLDQKPKYKIGKLIFEGSYNWPQLEPLLTVYYTNSFPEQALYLASKMESSLKQFNRPNISSESFLIPSEITDLQEEFWVKFEDATFLSGKISFTKYIKRLNKSLDFVIENEHLLPAFENIKGWFTKKLKSKRFFVKAAFPLVSLQTEAYSAQSDEIKLINKDFIDSIKISRTISICERPKLITSKALFAKDEIFSVISKDGLEENIFNQTEKEIIDLISNKFNVRNRPQLEFLSSEKQSEEYPIKYTLYPHFGFLFTIEKSGKCYFTWELLNSHATYVWIMKKSIDFANQIIHIENEIKKIKEIGREVYKQNNMLEINEHFHFQVINHNKKGINQLDEFEKWKEKLSDIII